MKVIKKPVEVNAWQVPFAADIDTWLEETVPSEVADKITLSWVDMFGDHILKSIKLQSLEGEMNVKAGDYIVQGSHDDIWVVQREIFEDTYEVIDND